MTIEQAYMTHPSSQRATGSEQWRYLGALAAFSTWSGITALDRVTLSLVQAYRDHLVGLGWEWDTRRHALLPLRRATKMAASFGLNDVLGRLRLDEQGPRPIVNAWTLSEIGKALQSLRDEPDQRAFVAAALGAMVGLRPSETFRIRCADLRADDRLPIGLLPGREREAKNNPSRRLLPIPPTIAESMRAMAAGRPAAHHLLMTSPGTQPKEGGLNKGAAPFNESSFGKWISEPLATFTERRLPARCLRKTFATWTRRERLDEDHREIYLGHETELAQGITGRHYTADLYEIIADELAPTCAAIEVILQRLLSLPRILAPPSAPPEPKALSINK